MDFYHPNSFPMANPFSDFQSVVRENQSLAPFTWLQIGGPTRYLVEPNEIDELAAITAICLQHGIPVRVLGGGSNLLVRESGVAGATLSLNSPVFTGIRREGDRVICGGGVKLSHLITYAVGQGLGGLEHLVAIPGTVGGAIRGNAGTEDGAIGQVVHSARILTKDGSITDARGEELALTHRASGMDGLALVEVTFALTPGDPAALTKREQTFWILKRRKQPSFPERTALAFIDPVGNQAADLVQQAGLSGVSEGAVRMSSTYPNFIIASTGATSSQVLALLERVRTGVQDRSGVQLQFHLQIW
jgi:UDP-N-acetylmuramate dehydrogenase